MGATIKDVAQRAEVSYQTVSRAVNHPETVAAGTLARVRAAMEALSWTPSPEARALQATRSAGGPAEPAE